MSPLGHSRPRLEARRAGMSMVFSPGRRCSPNTKKSGACLARKPSRRRSAGQLSSPSWSGPIDGGFALVLRKAGCKATSPAKELSFEGPALCRARQASAITPQGWIASVSGMWRSGWM